MHDRPNDRPELPTLAGVPVTTDDRVELGAVYANGIYVGQIAEPGITFTDPGDDGAVADWGSILNYSNPLLPPRFAKPITFRDPEGWVYVGQAPEPITFRNDPHEWFPGALDGAPYVWPREPFTCSEWWAQRRASRPLQGRIPSAKEALLRAIHANTRGSWALPSDPFAPYKSVFSVARCTWHLCPYTFPHTDDVCPEYGWTRAASHEYRPVNPIVGAFWSAVRRGTAPHGDDALGLNL